MQYYLEHGITLLQILDIAVNIVAGASGYWFLGAVLGYKFDGRLKKCVVYTLGIICSYLVLYLQLDRYLHDRNYTIQLISLFAYSLLFLKGKITTKAVVSVLSFELAMIGASVSTAIFSLFTGLPSMAAYELVGYRYIVFRCFDILLAVLLYYIVLIFLRKTKLLKNKSNYIGLSVLGLTTILIVFSTSLKENYYMSNALLTYIIIGIILINIVVYYFSFKRQKAEQAKAALEQKYEFQKAYIDDVNDLHQKLRQVKHDMKNHIQCAVSMISDDKKEDAISYLEELSQEVSVNLSHTVVTESDVINCILDDKFAACRKLGIKYDYVITGDNIKKVKDIDLSIILGNLLDNAIEASKNCEKKRIYLKISNEKAYLKIKVENTIIDSVLEKNPKLITSKPDGANHGLGIKSVESIVKRYNGLIDFYEQDGMFIFSAFLGVYNG